MPGSLWTLSELRRTPLYDLHQELGAKLVPFAGWAMPVHYPAGILAEHLHCRAAAALFDVSHMGQLRLIGPDVAARLEQLVPGNITGLQQGQARYTVFTNEAGGILDDLIVSQAGDHLFLVVNAGGREADVAHLRQALEPDIVVEQLTDRALLALQGPAAAEVLGRLAPDSGSLTFMQTAEMTVDGTPCRVSRLGYTGEDGFELSIPSTAAVDLARRLLAFDEVRPAGLGARDSLRLEAGLCLYGHDIDATTSPAEAQLGWTVPRRRREAADFPGAERIVRELARGPNRLLVGILPEGRAPAREGTVVSKDGRDIGHVTSGGYGPTLGGPLAMGYVEAAAARPGTRLELMVRGRALPATVTSLPFVAHRYHRAKG
jgi:aminomethyltransferase